MCQTGATTRQSEIRLPNAGRASNTGRMLQLEQVVQIFDGKRVLDGVDLLVPRGATAAVIGSSGSGKTTLLRVTLGLLRPEQGTVKISDQSLAHFGSEAWADLIGYVPQDGGLFPHLTGRQNICLVPRLRRWPQARIAGRLKELQQLVGLDDAVVERFPNEISGGQRQRVALIRAAMLDPAVMLLDEPMAALDPMMRSNLQQELKSIFQRLGKTVLLVTHDLGEAAFLADQITLLDAGRVVQTGSYADLRHRPAQPFVTRFINAQRTLPDEMPSQ